MTIFDNQVDCTEYASFLLPVHHGLNVLLVQSFFPHVTICDDENLNRSCVIADVQVGFFHVFRKPPWGGGNQFLLALAGELRRRGVRAHSIYLSARSGHLP